MAKVALYLKHPLAVIAGREASLAELSAETVTHAICRHVGEVPDHPRQRHPRVGSFP